MNPPASHQKRPRIAITVGDVAGVGPELALRCAASVEVSDRCQPILYGPQQALARIAHQVGLNHDGQLVNVGNVNADRLFPGQVTAETGRASFDAVDQAIDDTLAGQVDAIVTGPIQKEAWHAAGISFPGHTELLADRTAAENVCMMLTSKELSCVLATIHIPLADVPAALTTESILRAIRLAQERWIVVMITPHV